jgi:hypothetical protein
LFQQHGTGHQAPGATHEIFQKFEFFGHKFNRLALTFATARQQIKAQVFVAKLGWFCVCSITSIAAAAKR